MLKVFLIFLASFVEPGCMFVPVDIITWLPGGGTSHQSMTRAAFKETALEFFKEDVLTISMAIQSNILVDDDQEYAEYHFDGESFNEGQQRLQGHMNGIISNLIAEDPDINKARSLLGEALHTLQDFYAHSTWVEMKNDQTNPLLVRFGAKIEFAPEDMSTCASSCSMSALQLNPLNILCKDCSKYYNNPLYLTSGYYPGDHRKPLPGVVKCWHGGASQTWEALKKPPLDPLTVWHAIDGINKDSKNCDVAPHYWLHPLAADLARQSTVEYLQEIKSKVPDDRLRMLYGVGPSLGIAIDTSGSMKRYIEEIRKQLRNIIRERMATVTLTIFDVPLLYVIAEFNDPYVPPALKMTNGTEFLDAFDNIEITQYPTNTDCPELSFKGALNAIEKLDQGSTLFIISDASPKDFGLLPLVQSQALQKKIKVYPLIFYTECYKCPKDVPVCSPARDGFHDSCGEVPPECVRTPQFYEMYQSLADATGGKYWPLGPSAVSKVSILIDSYTQQNLVSLHTINSISGECLKHHSTCKRDNETWPEYHAFVDETMTMLIISIVIPAPPKNTSISVASISRPDGSSLFEDPGENVDILNEPGIVVIRIIDPQVGEWAIAVNNTRGANVNINAIANSFISSFDIVENRGRPGHMGYFPTNEPALRGSNVTVVSYLQAEVATAVFEFRDTGGNFMYSLNLSQGSGLDGEPPVNSFFGNITLPSKQAYVFVTGILPSGNIFQRVWHLPILNDIQNSTSINATKSSSVSNSTSPAPTPLPSLNEPELEALPSLAPTSSNVSVSNSTSKFTEVTIEISHLNSRTGLGSDIATNSVSEPRSSSTVPSKSLNLSSNAGTFFSSCYTYLPSPLISSNPGNTSNLILGNGASRT